MKEIRVASLIAACALLPLACHAQIGGTVFGNTTIFQNGIMVQQIGNTTVFSNGVTANQIGNTTIYSNGTSCNQIGETWICN